MSKDTKAPQSNQNPIAPPVPEKPQNPIAPPVPEENADEPDSPDEHTFKEREEMLNAALVEVANEYKALVADIQADGKFYDGFRKVKETFFRLQRIAAHNGHIPERREKSSKPNHNQFVRGGDRPGQSEAPAQRETSAPPADLFVRTVRNVEAPTTQAPNPKAPPLFQRTAPTPSAEPVIRNKKGPVPPDPKRKVLASSEENDD